MRVWKEKEVKMVVKKGVKEKCWLVKMKKSDGSEGRFVLKEVEKFWGEEEEGKEEEGGW